MGVLMVPPLDLTYPTLGPLVVEWLETYLVHGPGDVRAQPYRLDDEKRGVIFRLYEVFPKDHPRAGRRRFKRGGLSVRKGWAKTELAAAIAAAELHPDAPVRFDGWDANGDPVGIGVSDPYVPMVAYTEEQSEELAYGALSVMLAEGPLADDFDVALERILVKGHDGRAHGKAVALAAAPDSRDGARTTFQVFDETHRQASDRLKHAHTTMLANVPKRLQADAWTLEVTTAYEPGRQSIAESTHEYASLVVKGEIPDSRLFYYHREAADHHDLSTIEGMRAAVLEASGPAAAFTDVDAIVELGLDPTRDRNFWERVWLNRVVSSSNQVFPIGVWDELAVRGEGGLPWTPPDSSPVVLGFDGSRTNDSTALVLTEVATARQKLLALWERPTDLSGRPVDGWEVPIPEVDEAISLAFARWDVLRFYADPYFWETQVSAWEGRLGHVRLDRRRVPRVMPWPTNRPRPMAYAVRAYVGAIRGRELTHDGDPRMRAHLANARREDLPYTDDEGQPLYRMRKERPDSPLKMDAAMAGCLSWEAYRDVVALGAKDHRARSRVPRTI